jgi:hypothetical protein
MAIDGLDVEEDIVRVRAEENIELWLLRVTMWFRMMVSLEAMEWCIWITVMIQSLLINAVLLRDCVQAKADAVADGCAPSLKVC